MCCVCVFVCILAASLESLWYISGQQVLANSWGLHNEILWDWGGVLYYIIGIKVYGSGSMVQDIGFKV